MMIPAAFTFCKGHHEIRIRPQSNIEPRHLCWERKELNVGALLSWIVFGSSSSSQYLSFG